MFSSYNKAALAPPSNSEVTKAAFTLLTRRTRPRFPSHMVRGPDPGRLIQPGAVRFIWAHHPSAVPRERLLLFIGLAYTAESVTLRAEVPAVYGFRMRRQGLGGSAPAGGRQFVCRRRTPSRIPAREIYQNLYDLVNVLVGHRFF